MDEYTMSAFAVYPDGRSGEAFAEVSEDSLGACFEAMSKAVADWLPEALAGGVGTEPPEVIELTLQWSGAPAPTPAPDRPLLPRVPERCRKRPPLQMSGCTAPRRPGCRAGSPLPGGALGALA